MPGSTPTSTRTIKATPPTRTGSYAPTTKPYVQGKSSNKTADYLAAMPAEHPGQQGFYREALNDIPHPLEPAKTLTYGQLQEALNGPQRGAMLDAYARQNKLPRATAEQMEAAAFTAAKDRLLARGAAKPGELAFSPAADAAFRAPATQQGIAHGNYVQPGTGQMQNAASLAQRYADGRLTQQSTMTAPGMSAQPLAPQMAVAPAPTAATVAKRVIRGSGPLIAGN